MVYSGVAARRLAEAILTLLQTPDRLVQWGQQAKALLEPTYLQEHCLNRLEKLYSPGFTFEARERL